MLSGETLNSILHTPNCELGFNQIQPISHQFFRADQYHLFTIQFTPMSLEWIGLSCAAVQAARYDKFRASANRGYAASEASPRA